MSNSIIWHLSRLTFAVFVLITLIPFSVFAQTEPPHIESIYNEKINAPKAERITITELELMREALELLTKTNWDGDNNSPLPLTSKDFDRAQLKAYVKDTQDDLNALIIPNALAPIYLAPAATKEIAALMFSARREYLEFLKSKGVRAEYIEEIEKIVLPPDPNRLTYHPENDPQAPSTATSPTEDSNGDKRYGSLQIDVYPVDIYNAALSLEKSQILIAESSAVSQRKLRDIGLRYLVYHEMTHILQRAYINRHAPEKYRQDKGAEIYANKRLDQAVDTQYHWRWGDSDLISELNNRHISDESQADGIAYEIVTTVYNMSPQQKAAVWDHLFGRLEKARTTLDTIKVLCATHYPKLIQDEFGSLLSHAFDDYQPVGDGYLLTKAAFRLSALSAYIGYMNPMRPEDTPKFWKVLQQD